jgi:hypothetical protein
VRAILTRKSIGRKPHMAVRDIAHKPDLTTDQAREIFRKHFEPAGYTVDDVRGPFRDFMVVKNPWIGVALKLEQDADDNQTKFVYSGLAPRWWARALLGGLIGFLFWNGLTNEIEAFIDSAPEFH